MVGPFVFFDQMGPVVLARGKGLDVRPHPHIGLATVTYLFEGEIVHRDSLGTVQTITPGAVNWMTAGRGIVHSERSPAEQRALGPKLSGLQLWVALPKEAEERAPEFLHYGADVLPIQREGGVELRVIVGGFQGVKSPVAVLSEMFYVDASLQSGARLALAPEYEERAFYVITGQVTLEPDEGGVFSPGEMVVVRPGARVTLRAGNAPVRLVLVGGAPVGPRYIRWNFVSSSLEHIASAADEWKEQRFPKVPGETEFIPLPEDLSFAVRYP